jgi:hypothetical protein
MIVFLFNAVIHVFLFLCLCILIVRLCIFILPAGTLRLPWLRFFRAFSSVVKQMSGCNSQRRGTARTLPKFLCFSMYCLFLCRSVLFVCKCVLYYCHRVSTQLQLTDISSIIYHIQVYMQFYDISCMHPHKQPGRWQDVLDIKHTIKLHVQICLRMNTWMFETCRRQRTKLKP